MGSVHLTLFENQSGAFVYQEALLCTVSWKEWKDSFFQGWPRLQQCLQAQQRSCTEARQWAQKPLVMAKIGDFTNPYLHLSRFMFRLEVSPGQECWSTQKGSSSWLQDVGQKVTVTELLKKWPPCNKWWEKYRNLREMLENSLLQRH